MKNLAKCVMTALLVSVYGMVVAPSVVEDTSGTYGILSG